MEQNCRDLNKKRTYRYPCPECRKLSLTKLFVTKLQAADHLKREHQIVIKNVKNFCFECNKEVDDHLNHVMRVHSCNFACTFCGARFLTEDKALHHEETKHFGETADHRPFRCHETNCGYSFKSIQHLKSHHRALHAEKEEEFKCPHCPKIFSRKMHLQVHTRQHFSSFACNFEDCARVFKKLNNLKEHMERDHGISEIYLCNLNGCTERFKKLVGLKLHREGDHLVAFNVQKYFDPFHFVVTVNE